LTRPGVPETEVAFDGIAAFWCNDMASFQRAAATAEVRRLTDGALFIGSIKT
jgi:hypothetical protein